MPQRPFLPDAQFEFVIISDTHYMLKPPGAVEFESRRHQTARAERALQMIASLKPEPAFVVHLGDLVQEFPETPGFGQAMTEARAQLARCGVQPYLVAGNHDIGDKPDPSMPTDWVTPASLGHYHATFGRSWYSWDVADCHFVALNSQIMNAALPETAAQQNWLTADLAAHADRRLFLFLHLAPFLCHTEEPSLGHYDNIAPPARDWLLDLVRRYRVQGIFSGHSHFAFFNRIAETRHYGLTSPAFTRPGFSELFSSSPPAEQGRNDTAKLGFYLIRVHPGDARLHFIRTNRTDSTDSTDRTDNIDRTGSQTDPTPPESAPFISGITRDLSQSPLGVVLNHPLAHRIDVPLAWPSTIRQPVRNDYPLLACLELGVRHIRLPAEDLTRPLQQERLSHLRDEGVRVTATWFWSEPFDLAEQVAGVRSRLDSLELQLLGHLWPDADALHQLRRCRTDLEIPITLSPIIPRERVPGKQHLRTRTGYRPAELPELNRRLTEAGLRLHRVLVQIDANAAPWETLIQTQAMLPLSQIDHLDWLIPFATLDEQQQLSQAAEALFAAALSPGCRLFFAPLVDLDRTMDVTHGLLDRACNPRPVFHALRTLNTILSPAITPWQAIDPAPISGAKTCTLQNQTTILHLILPAGADPFSLPATLIAPPIQAQAITLVQGTIHPLSATHSHHFHEALLLIQTTNPT